MVAMAGRHYCRDAYCIWLLTPLSVKELILLQNLFVKHQQNSCWTPPINSNNHAYLVSQHLVSECSVQAKKIILYSSTRLICRNTFKWFWQSAFCFTDLLSLPILLCFFVHSTCDIMCKTEEAIRMQNLVYFQLILPP